MQHGVGAVLGKRCADRSGIGDVDLAELVARVVGDRGDGSGVTGVGEFVEVQDLVVGVCDEASDDG